jgi:uncharacterized protein YutE (UPF0331/DUF86 family)
VGVDRERLAARFPSVRSQRAARRRLAAGVDAERFAVDPLMAPAALYRLQTAIGSLSDVAYHRCAKALQYAPRDAHDAFAHLVSAGRLPAERAPALRAMVRFRNRVVDGYLDRDARQVFQVLREGLGAIEATLADCERRVAGPPAVG